MRFKIIASAALVGIATVAFAAQLTITGPARVIDGDTLEIGGERIRLHGVDAPERGQTCLLLGRRYPCGVDATESLRKLVRGKEVTCTTTGRDR